MRAAFMRAIEEVEDRNQPVLLRGLVSAWPAVQQWSGAAGLQRLAQLAGQVTVQVMLSKGQFVGDMQHLLLLSCRLEEFLSGELLRQMQAQQPLQSSIGMRSPKAADAHAYAAYLAQCPISAAAGRGAGLQPGPLHALAADAPRPELLSGVSLSQVNFWASITPTRSSCHYDPYSNLLCVAAGSKVVRLLPPSATGLLSAQPVYHESANHSPVDLAEPDLERFPALAAALPLLQTFSLEAGDALYLPEGWWHQVESSAHTFAVNHWWESNVAARLGTPAYDTFLLRRLAQSLQEQEKQRVLAGMEQWDLGTLRAAPEVQSQLAQLDSEQPGWNKEGWLLSLGTEEGTEDEGSDKRQQAKHALSRRLEGSELAALGALLSQTEAHAQQHLRHPDAAIAAEADAILASLAAEGAEVFMRVLLVLREQRPAAAAHLLLHVLSPRAWELLSSTGERHEESLAAQGSSVQEAEQTVQLFFDRLYSAVGDRQQLLDVILQRKEALARSCLATVLRQALSVPELRL